MASSEEEANKKIIMHQRNEDLHKTKLREEKYAENIMFNVITIRNLSIMNMNAERNSQINKEAVSISPRIKENPLKQLFLSCHLSKDTHNKDL